MRKAGAVVLEAKRVLLGITGGIAAYKAADLSRRLVEAGAEVQVVMTRAACAFITPMTLQAVSGRAVRTELFDPEAEAGMGHIELARWPHAVLVAPASADFLARLAHGLADDLLSTLCLATDKPMFVAPAMNRLMWANAATQRNVSVLRERGIVVLGPGTGAQACGETGEGRMLEPLALADALAAGLAGPAASGPLAGLRVLLTAGPTREMLDPVRFITNRSSGRMGFAVARAAAAMGADVTLVAGPVSLATPPDVRRIDVESAEDMQAAVTERAPEADIFVATAAVSDYRPAAPADRKIKKSEDRMQLDLVRNPDILARVAAMPDGPFTVGFAAETHDVAHHARGKLERKGLDMIAANRVGPGLAFDQECNALHLFWAGGEEALAMAPKEQLAGALMERVAERYRAQN
jgi:phosphopantothenoylcysteine decarboxylase/phosphopantothenate--cysteine ligase